MLRVLLPFEMGEVQDRPMSCPTPISNLLKLGIIPLKSLCLPGSDTNYQGPFAQTQQKYQKNGWNCTLYWGGNGLRCNGQPSTAREIDPIKGFVNETTI